MPKAPLSQPGRYAELDVDQLADTVERSYDRHDLPDWELGVRAQQTHDRG